MLTSSLFDYIDAYILVNGRITITGTEAGDETKRLYKRNKEVTFKNCAAFTGCMLWCQCII